MIVVIKNPDAVADEIVGNCAKRWNDWNERSVCLLGSARAVSAVAFNDSNYVENRVAFNRIHDRIIAEGKKTLEEGR